MMLANLCWQCGDIGLSDALVFCLKCQIVRMHSYCLEEIPADLSGEINWLCEDCRVQVRNSTSKARFSQTLSLNIQSHGYGKTKIGLKDPSQDIVSVTNCLISHQDQYPAATVRTGSDFNNASSNFKRETSSCNTGTSGGVRSSACLGLSEDEIGGDAKEKPKRRKSSLIHEDELNNFLLLVENEDKGKPRLEKTDSLRIHGYCSARTNIGSKECRQEIVYVNDHLINPQSQHPTAAVRSSSGLNMDNLVCNDLQRDNSSCNTALLGVVRSSGRSGPKEDEIGEYAKEKPKRRKCSSPDEDELDSSYPQVEAEGTSKRFPKTVSPRTDDHVSGRTKIGLKGSYRESCSVNDSLLNPQDQHPAAAVRIRPSLNKDSYVLNDFLRETSSCNTGAFIAVGLSTCLGLKENEMGENVKEMLMRRKLCLPNEDELENFEPLVERQVASCLMGDVIHTAGQTGIRNSQINIPCQIKSLPMPSHFWSGCFNISNKKFGPFKAHLSALACKKVCDLARQLPLDLHMQKLPRLDAWPNSFKTSPPIEDNIALFIFPLCDRVEAVLDELVDDIINNDLMLRFQFDEVELLIFSAIVLPRELQRISGKYYPWGVFRPRIVQECSALEDSQVNTNTNGVEKGVQVANTNRLENGIQVDEAMKPANSWDEGIEDDYDNDETLGPAKEIVGDHDNKILEDATQVANGLTLRGSLIPPGKERGGVTSSCSKESKWPVINVADYKAACDEEKLQAHLDIGSLSENCTLGSKEVAQDREVRVHTAISRERPKVFRELEEGEIWEDDEYAAVLQSGVECQSELNEPDKVWQRYEEKQHMEDLGISGEGQKASSELEIGEFFNDEFSDEVSKQHAEDDLEKEKQQKTNLVFSRERLKNSEDTLGWEICDDVFHGDSINSEQSSLQLFPTDVEDMAIAVRLRTARKDDIDLKLGLGLPTFDNHDAGDGASEKRMLFDSPILY